MNIINAKFSPTAIEKAFIQRSELLEKMTRDKDKNVIFVTAPAGYGKTTLLSQFNHMTDEKVMWYHLDVFDNEIVTFMTYLSEGIARCLGKHQEDIIPFLNERINQGDIKGLVADLLNYLSQKSQDHLCIIFDDFHYLTEDLIHECIAIFIKYMPSNIRLIIASRTQPALDLDFLFTSHRFAEISIEQLKFSQAEENTFIDKIKPSHQDIYNIELIRKNNGWPFGLNLLQHAISENLVSGYEIQELYKKCFDNIFEMFDDQEFLRSTCLLEILDVEACNYIINRTDAYDTLMKMSRKGLFISKIHSGVFKYHDLFRDYLQEKVSNKKEVYEKISAYYIHRNNILEAIDYLLLSRDYDKADALLKKDQYIYVSIAYYSKIYHWEKKISTKTAYQYGSFSLIKALIALKNLDVESGRRFIENARTLFLNQKEDEGLLKADIIWVKVLRMEYKADEAYALANRIYKKIQDRPLDEKMDILSEKLYISSFLSRVDEEFIVLKNEILGIDENHIKTSEVQVFALLEYAAYLIGEYRTAMSIQAKYRDRISPLNSIIYTIRIYMVWGHLEEGKTHVLKEIDNAKRFGLNANLPELYGILAELEFHHGEYGHAEKYFKKTMECFEDKNNNLYHLSTFTYATMLAFLGRKDEALEMVSNYYPRIPKDNHLGYMMVDMMLSQMYLILKDYDLAIEYAKRAMVPSEAFGTKLYVATLSAVIATAYLAKGDERNVLKYAQTTMDLSESGYYIQDFMTFYEYYKPLYHFCIQNNIHKAFIEEIKNRVGQGLVEQEKNDSEKLYVRFFGDNIVKAGGKLVRWRTVKAKHIFYYLLYHNKTGVTKDKLMDTFFEHYDLDKANGNIRTSLTYIRKAMQDVGFEDIVWQANGRYFISDKFIATDLMRFSQCLESMKNRDEDFILSAKALSDFYKGAFCEDIDIYEFNLDKEKYFTAFQNAILKAVSLLEEKKDYKEAVNFMNILIQHQNYNESYYQKKAELYHKMGDQVMMKKTDEELWRIKEKTS
ncbi:AAA family ATPase [Petrocella sp. FN5]|uniref:AAA family ATPase n=1 Tax=Petrocella sp. FN5 TaxID=3032002 RepID=UPI0023DC26D0|nr:AAA family ATPase [Petrocella sp. FN5]MDF1618292.1 AAA family ATPase [Petrocella sp. FN5]